MTRWFRFYDDALNDPKILKLSDRLYRIWVGILCVASKNDGQLPALEDMALMVRMKPEKLEQALGELEKAELIDRDGVVLSPHNWNGRQYKSDVSTPRVKRFRDSKRNVSETPPETDTEAKTEKKDSRRVAKATAPDAFDEFWKAYPARAGENPKAPARKLFDAAVKRGIDPQVIIAAIKIAATRHRDKVGTQFIPRASTWLSEKRWEEYVGQTVATGSSALPIDWPGAVARYHDRGLWTAPGPEPGYIGCKAPPDILAKHGYGPNPQLELARTGTA